MRRRSRQQGAGSSWRSSTSCPRGLCWWAGNKAEASADQIHRLQDEIERLRNQGQQLPEAMQAELERLRKERTQNLQDRLGVRVLEIDSKTGGLYYLDPDRIDVATQTEAQ